MCYTVKGLPNVSDKKKFKSHGGIKKAVTDAFSINPNLDVTQIKVVDNHTGKEVKLEL